MTEFVDTRTWPLVHLHMPIQVNDSEADALLDTMTALYDRASPFVLLMGGAELPRHSPRFMTAYVRWSNANFVLQQRYCLGTVRIEADPVLRRHYLAKAQAWTDSGQVPYPYRVVATLDEAQAQAQAWLQSRGAMPHPEINP